MRAEILGSVSALIMWGMSPAWADLAEVVGIADGDTLNVRSGPGTEFSDIGDIQEGKFVNVVGTNAAGTWAQIRYQGQSAWVSMSHLSSGLRPDGASNRTGPHQVTGIQPDDPDGGLVVRAGQGADFASIGVLPNGTNIHVIQTNRENTWSMIAFGTGIGWVRNSYLSSVSAGGTHPQPMPTADPTTAPDGLPLPAVFHVSGVAADDVFNIRSAPSANADIIHMVANGIPISVLGMASGAWAKVQLHNTVGFAHTGYLERGGGTTTMTGFQLGLECIGTEPFWNMTFGVDNMVRMNLMGNSAAAVPLTSTSVSPTSTGYSSHFAAAPYSGQINHEICSDGMSDNTYPMSILLNGPNAVGDPMVAHGCCQLQ